MKEHGYNVNFGVVADVADNIHDLKINLVEKQRIFSDKPEIVSELACKMVEAMNIEGITPVVKHFPGLGRVRYDTHKWLPKLDILKEEIYKKDIFPFKELIKKNEPFWIMTSHAVYTCFDDKPASLSYKVQNDILRKELGFKGIIISDELLNMQAIRGYAFEKNIKEPYINEITIMAFKAGTDIVIIYPERGKAEELIGGVIEAVSKAVKEGRITESEINDSFERILKEKERIFNRHLLLFIKDMTLEQKIAQKIIIDIYEDKDTAILNKYSLGGIEARDYNLIERAQRNAKIPLFIAGQHEGGKVNETNLNIYSQSADLTGREFEKILGGGRRKQVVYAIESDKDLKNKPQEAFFDFSQMVPEEQRKIIDILCDTVDGHIKFYAGIKEGKYMLSNPDYFSPLTTVSDVSHPVEVKPFEALPIAWIMKFPDKNSALCAYKIFKEAFNKRLAKENISSKLVDNNSLLFPEEMIFKLNLLKEEIKKNQGEEIKKPIRILCLAAHPDDEDAEALIYFKKKFDAKTYILLATRGEGGENRIGSELYQELGALRTEEIERSASVLGVNRVFYLGKRDFGYCCETEEAFKKWNRQDTLSRLVYFYRLIQPDIIVTKHNVSSEHCQHQALAYLAQEAFDLAGNPKAYPEMIKDGLLPWQPLRFYQRATGKKDYPLDEIVIDTQECASSEGKTYQQIAREALSQHASQVFSKNFFSAMLPAGEIGYELVKTSNYPLRENFLNNDASAQKTGKVIPSGFPGIKIVNGLKIGLLEENSGILFIALKTLGCDFKKIDTKFIAEANFSDFDIIILNKGMSNLLSELKDVDKQLLKFVEEGGSLIILLQDSIPEEFSLAPYPLKISFEPICNKDTTVTILVSGHPLFNFPNKITTRDFEGWIQDRGFVAASGYPVKYTELTSSLSCTSKVVKGAYLVAHYGRGNYIFTTYSWYRQLREFHLGAYKNLANMVAYSYSEQRLNSNP